MTLAKGSSAMVYPKTLLSIAISVGGLAIFLTLGSLLLVSQPIGSTFHDYFYGIDHSNSLGTVSRGNPTITDSRSNIDVEELKKVDLPGVNGTEINPQLNDADGDGSKRSDLSMLGKTQSVSDAHHGGIDDVIGKNRTSEPQDTNEPTNLWPKDRTTNSPNASVVSETQDRNAVENAVSTNVTEGVLKVKPPLQDSPDSNTIKTEKSSTIPVPSYTNQESVPGHQSKSGSVDSGCDLYHGNWVYDSTGPLYGNNSCPVLTQMQNCQGNGRPDKEYENWRWKPAQCDLPRFDAKKFLELMRGKTLAFIGDSVARNQMESMLCILWQVETPKNRGNRRMQRYYFRSTSTMIVRIWSSWLVHETSGPLDYAPEGVVKLHLDSPDEDFMEYIPNFDVVVLSSGHWFAKQSVYVLNKEIVGGQLWWPDKSRPMKINNIEAFGISVETILSSIVTHPNYTGLTILRSYSPDHYEGGAWNTGGSCTGKVKPATDGELVESGFTNTMHDKQVRGFNRALKKKTNKSKLVLMDITKAFAYRHDGHPGPYRSPDPNKITKRGPDGKPPPQDCLHWCMPGPVDTWNELVLEIMRRELDGRQNFPS